VLHRLLSVAMLAALLLWGVGCSENPTGTEDQIENLNLNDPTGGYLATDESPGFGDSDLLAEANDNDEYDDPFRVLYSSDMTTDTTLEGGYHLRILWGQLRFDPTVTTVTDWTGSLIISRGAMVVRQVIAFEPDQDALLERTDRRLVEWTSFTTVHHDGLAVDIYIPPDTATIPEVVTVAFETGPYSRTFDLSELVALDTIVYLDDADSNAVAFHAFRLDRMLCARGFLAGRWGFNEDGQGVFRGMWMTRDGRISGWLRGHWGVNDDGDRVFFGKWISRDGRFQGFLRGRWDQHPSHNANPNAVKHAGGWFKGDVLDANRQVIGALKGKYKSHPQFKKGFFQGRWKLGCDEYEPDREEGW